jgi:membrane fusion protein (multidrug efflux system)
MTKYQMPNTRECQISGERARPGCGSRRLADGIERTDGSMDGDSVERSDARRDAEHRTRDACAPQLIALLAVVICFAMGCKKQAVGTAKMPAPQVVVAEARVERVVETLPRVANIQANEMVDIKAEIDGVVQEILFEEGQQVEKGHLLVRLDETKLAANLAQAEANFKLSEANFARAKQLSDDKLISQQEFEQSAATFQANQANLDFTRRLLKDARIVAPFEGVVSSRPISPGQIISKNTIITWLIDLDPVKVEFHVPEKFLGQVKTNQQIKVEIEAYPNEDFSGEVFFVSPYVDPTNRTALVKAYISNKEMKLKPGMFAEMTLTLVVRERSTVIPEMAITQVLTNSQAMVFAVDGAGMAQMRKIKTGVRLIGSIEVLEGLKPGEKVIVEGLQKVVPGAPVRIAPPEADASTATEAGSAGTATEKSEKPVATAQKDS